MNMNDLACISKYLNNKVVNKIVDLIPCLESYKPLSLTLGAIGVLQTLVCIIIIYINIYYTE